ncbi:MAG: zinc ribbon domain-containing protein [Candidatus Cloacimonetes bacterium]|nr:zinc ribbon domain-containing protein [Candidatus Cloacimonadota bacterium]
MQCKGEILEKNKLGNKVNRTCNEKLKEHAIFCPVCGTPTAALKTDLSALQNLRQGWDEFRMIIGRIFPFSIFMAIIALGLPVLALYLGSGDYFRTNLFLLLTVPFALVFFTLVDQFQAGSFQIGMYVKNLKYYPAFFLFTMINILYYILLKIICTGYLLNLATDPILHLVRFIMAIYWMAIILPVPYLMIEIEKNPLKAILLAYKAGSETRWQHFFLLVFILLINFIGMLLAGVGLFITLSFSYYLIYKYSAMMRNYELFNKPDKE